MLKVIGINGSPRKGWNTDLMLQSALKGAKDAGASVKYYQLADLKVKTCTSCLVCKQKKGYTGICTVKDDLTNILKEIKTADALVMGTPIYYGWPSALLHDALERIWFSNSAYTQKRTQFPGVLKTLMIYTMNQNETSAQMYKPLFQQIKMFNERIFKGPCTSLCAFDTKQVKDYSKYNMQMFDPEKKKLSHEKQFPIDLQKAYECGYNLIKG